MPFFDGIKNVIVKWLGIVPPLVPVQITIRENMTRELNTLKNQLWYRGDPVELEQFYKTLAELTPDSSGVIKAKFWAAVPENDALIRKFHSGLPRVIADKLSSIVVEDMMEPDMDQGLKSRWDEFDEDVSFDDILKEAVQKVLSEGDGAFKICVDTTVSPLPLLEFYSGNQVELKFKRGKLQEIHFFTDYFQGAKHYKLAEYYGKGYVRYKLFDDMGGEVALSTLPDTENLVDVTFAGDFIMGVPLLVLRSAKWANRGESIFEGKGDMFDALDECLSTWLDALRAGRVKQYIPEALIPRNEDNGRMLKPNVFNPYLIKNTLLQEDADNKIDVVQGSLEFEGLLLSYTTILDCCLQGLISPSTLGIDVKKLDNAESQREKEKTTMYTRDTIIGALAKTLPKLVEAVLKTQDNMKNQTPPDRYESTFEWGQYANPSFEAMVETIGKAKQFQIMSTEQCIEELYGDTMSDEDKAEEVARIKEEYNPAIEVDEPAVGDDVINHMAEEKAGEGVAV